MAIRTYPNLAAFFQGEGRIQTQVAHQLGISKGLLSMIKWGERQPDLELALRITDLCHVPLESLIKRQPRAVMAKAKPRRLRPAVVKLAHSRG